MNKLLLVDDSNLLFQMFFGMPARIVNKQGKAIHGTLGFVGALLKIIRKTGPTHIAVFFDGEHQNPRSEISPDYKADRTDYSNTPEEETPFSQLPDIYAALDHMHISHTETRVCEADDLISGYVHTYGRENEIIISSLDSDFFQLIASTVSVLRYRGDNTIICTPDYIKEKFGILPSQYADFKSLTGDASDNIKGADKVGLKTAAALLEEFGTLENILANAEKIKKPSIKKSILQNSEQLRINYKLIRLDNSASLPFALHQLGYSFAQTATGEILKGIGLR